MDDYLSTLSGIADNINWSVFPKQYQFSPTTTLNNIQSQNTPFLSNRLNLNNQIQNNINSLNSQIYLKRAIKNNNLGNTQLANGLFQQSLIPNDEIQQTFTPAQELGELDLNESKINPVSEASRALRESRMSKAGSYISMTSDMLGSFLPEKDEYSGLKGHLISTLDSAYDNVANNVSQMGPYGALIGGIMKGGSLLGKGLNAIGGGTDAQTTLDSVLGSSFLNLTPLGLINGFFGKKSNNFEKDVAAFNTTGSAYLGTEQEVDDALSKSNKKYGLFSSNARRKANSQIRQAAGRQDIISNIADQVQDYYNLMASMDVINNNRYDFELRGGYNQNDIRIGKSGLKFDTIDKAKNILSKFKDQQVNHLQEGGEFEYYLSTLPENQRDSTNYRVKDYWIFNGKPKDFKEARAKDMFTLEDNGWHAKSIAENPETGEIEFMKSATHPTVYMETDWFEKGLVYNRDKNGNITTIQLKPGVKGYEDWLDFTNNYELIKSKPYYKYVKKKNTSSYKEGGKFTEETTIELTVEETTIELIEPIQEFKEGGTIESKEEPIEETTIELTVEETEEEPEEESTDEIPEFKEGGSVNVIPEGALHARKHHMEMDGITKKGIPVVDNNGTQQAEIENSELIIRLEVTQEIERLYKIYYSEESSKKEKDEVALEAGKLLVNEILYNTIDNTNKLL